MNPWSEGEDRRKLESVRIGAAEVRPGGRVRLHPRGRADIFDLVLAGKSAVVEAIEQDFEGRAYLAVIVEDDPGADLGMLRQPGHRFFFSPEEVEPMIQGRSETVAMKILVAGVGNIFLGDDAFGVEVVRRLALRPQRVGVRVVDFGIRGLDLAYAILDGYDAVLVVDAMPRGGEPGTLYVLEPELGTSAPEPALVEGHNLDPVRVLALVSALGGDVRRLLVVGCEPEPADEEDDFRDGLSPPVAAAVDEAVALVESLIARLC